MTTHPASVTDAHVARTVAITIAYNNHPTLPSPLSDPPLPTVYSTSCCLSCDSWEAFCPTHDIH